jgi:alanyl-tRNA synthetase
VKKSLLLNYFLKNDSLKIIDICEEIIRENSKYYDYLNCRKQIIFDQIKKEIDSFEKFIKSSNEILRKRIELSPEISGKDVFFFYDTKGIPLEFINNFFLKNGIIFPEKDFLNLLDEQRNKGAEDRNRKKIKTF